jgi:hypothetical protein
MAKSISVALADMETIDSGCLSRVSLPLSPVTVTGHSAADDPLDLALLPEEEPPQAVSAMSSESSSAARAAALEGGVVRGTGMPL